MGGFEGCCRYRPRVYKPWRYPGVPIPQRLRSVYSDDPRKCRPRA